MRYLLVIFTSLSLSTFGQDNLSRAYEHVRLADSLYAAGSTSGAIDHLQKALITKKSDPDIYLFLSRCYLETGGIGQAKKYLRRASRIGNQEAQHLLDSLKGRPQRPVDQEFQNDLEEYLEKTGPPNGR